MFEQAFKNIDDVLWKEAGCTTELDYTEQTSWLLFLKYLDGLEQDRADEAGLSGKRYSYILDKPYRWETWAAPKAKNGTLDHNKAMTGDDLRDFVNGRLFPYLHGFKQKATGPNTIEYKIGEIFGEIKNKISSGYNLREIIDHIDALRFRSQKEKHELSELYEAKIQRMGNAGRNGGEYYTPRPLIRAMVRVVAPQIGERIYDGACGSAGFLCESFEYLTDEAARTRKLTTKDLTTLQTRTFHGKEKKSLAYVIAIMNMILHGIEAPNILHTNTLTENLADIQEKDRFDVVLANPPFGGKERKEVQQNFPIRTGETAFLFLQHFIKMLKAGGRGGVVIKNTFLSNTDNASVSLRKLILESCQLHTVLDCPGGTFQGAGVKTVVLFFEIHRNTKLAVVEAKAWDEELTEGVAQAKDYAGKLAVRFTYSSNGQGVYAIDMESGVEGPVPQFPGPEELWNRTFAETNAWRDRFADVPFEDRGGYFQPRYYQDIAIDRVLEAIAADKTRILLTLATGTGKTFIAFQIAWKLFHSRWNVSREPNRRPRILFLADRTILADQAYNAFSAFAEDALVRIAPDEVKKKGRVPTNGNLFFTIFQTFMSGPPKDGNPNYCQRVTANDGALGEQHLRDFQDNEKSIPTILTTSQKLSTGVDARNIRNIVLMRPINSMIEFKQIIGRGTRLFEGKDYFTIYDFVKAHHHFSDPEWDGEPEPPEVPEPCPKCGQNPCECAAVPPNPCAVCGQLPCICPPEPCPKCGRRPCVCRKKVKVKLADGKARTIQHMMVTSFWHPDGTPMSAQQFLEMLFGKLPEFFKNEAELRELWSSPDTRAKLLAGLAEKGFGREQMAEMQKIIDAEKSDLFDGLAHVAYALPTMTRKERAESAKVAITGRFTDKQQLFLDFVLSHYVSVGVEELDQEKLTPLLRLRYRDSIADAVADLGKPDEIGRVFAGFQKYLYQGVA